MALPINWSVDIDTLREATAPSRVKENIVKHTRGGVTSASVAIFAEANPPFVGLRLAKLTEDAIERLDAATGKEELIEAKAGQYFAESVCFVVNTTNGLAMGEFKPNALSVLGKWPGLLISKALEKLGTVDLMASQPVAFRPFLTLDFLERAVGRAVKKIKLKVGPISPQLMEQAGLGSEAVEQLTLEENILGLNLDLAVSPTTPLNKGLTNRLESWAKRLGDAGATELYITLEDDEAFNLLDENLIFYATGVEVSRTPAKNEVREKILAKLEAELRARQAELAKLRA